MLSVQMAIVGVAAPIYSISGFSLYPVDVRATGFSLGHNLAAMIGGFAPLMISSVQVVLPSATGINSVYSVALVMGAGAVFSLLGCFLVAWLKPEANYTRDIYQAKVAAREMDLATFSSETVRMALPMVDWAHETQPEKKYSSNDIWELNNMGMMGDTANGEDRSIHSVSKSTLV